MYNIFPNCSLTFGADGVLLATYDATSSEPEQCVFDHWYYAFTPSKGEEVLRAQTNVRVDAKELNKNFLTMGTGLWALSQTKTWPSLQVNNLGYGQG